MRSATCEAANAAIVTTPIVALSRVVSWIEMELLVSTGEKNAEQVLEVAVPPTIERGGTLTPIGVPHLMAIADYIRSDNPQCAATFVNELMGRCETLAEFSARFPLVPPYESHGIGRCVYGNYLIFYRLNVEQVEVIHVLNGAQDYERRLFPEE